MTENESSPTVGNTVAFAGYVVAVGIDGGLALDRVEGWVDPRDVAPWTSPELRSAYEELERAAAKLPGGLSMYLMPGGESAEFDKRTLGELALQLPHVYAALAAVRAAKEKR